MPKTNDDKIASEVLDALARVGYAGQTTPRTLLQGRIDSVQALEAIVDLENRLLIPLADRDLLAARTIGDFVSCVVQAVRDWPGWPGGVERAARAAMDKGAMAVFSREGRTLRITIENGAEIEGLLGRAGFDRINGASWQWSGRAQRRSGASRGTPSGQASARYTLQRRGSSCVVYDHRTQRAVGSVFPRRDDAERAVARLNRLEELFKSTGG